MRRLLSPLRADPVCPARRRPSCSPLPAWITPPAVSTGVCGQGMLRSGSALRVRASPGAPRRAPGTGANCRNHLGPGCGVALRGPGLSAPPPRHTARPPRPTIHQYDPPDTQTTPCTLRRCITPKGDTPRAMATHRLRPHTTYYQHTAGRGPDHMVSKADILSLRDIVPGHNIAGGRTTQHPCPQDDPPPLVPLEDPTCPQGDPEASPSQMTRTSAGSQVRGVSSGPTAPSPGIPPPISAEDLGWDEGGSPSRDWLCW